MLSLEEGCKNSQELYQSTQIAVERLTAERARDVDSKGGARLGKPLFAALRGIILVAFQTVPLVCAWAQAITSSDVKSVISTEEFYTKNKLTLVIDSAPGGGYDTYGRLLARFYGANIPGRPAVVVQNMPGVGGLTAVNWLAQVAPRDGSAIQIMSRSIPLAPLMGTPGARFEPLDLSWIGSMNRENIIGFSWHTTKFNTIDDLRKRTANVGVTGTTADSALFTQLLKNLVGTRLKIIFGYPGDCPSSEHLAQIAA